MKLVSDGTIVRDWLGAGLFKALNSVGMSGIPSLEVPALM
jgi:hypothetical protein